MSDEKLLKKNKKVLFGVKVYVQSSFNNTLINITDLNGNTLAWSSAGGQGFKGSKKSTPYAASIAAVSVAQKIKDKFLKDNRQKKILAEVFINGPGIGGESVVRSLSEYFDIEKISNITGIPHNGCRPKKERRV